MRIKYWFFERRLVQWFLRLFGLIDRYQWCNFVYLSPEEIEYAKIDIVEVTKTRMLAEAKRFLPERAWNRIKIIYHPLGSCGSGFLDDPLSYRASVAWKYTPERHKRP